MRMSLGDFFGFDLDLGDGAALVENAFLAAHANTPVEALKNFGNRFALGVENILLINILQITTSAPEAHGRYREADENTTARPAWRRKFASLASISAPATSMKLMVRAMMSKCFWPLLCLAMIRRRSAT